MEYSKPRTTRIRRQDEYVQSKIPGKYILDSVSGSFHPEIKRLPLRWVIQKYDPQTGNTIWEKGFLTANQIGSEYNCSIWYVSNFWLGKIKHGWAKHDKLKNTRIIKLVAGAT